VAEAANPSLEIREGDTAPRYRKSLADEVSSGLRNRPPQRSVVHPVFLFLSKGSGSEMLSIPLETELSYHAGRQGEVRRRSKKEGSRRLKQLRGTLCEVKQSELHARKAWSW